MGGCGSAEVPPEGQEAGLAVVTSQSSTSGTSSTKDCDYSFKILLIGDSGVGKTSLLFRFVDDTFTESYMSTIGIDFKFKTVVVDGKKIKMQIWDTAGQERAIAAAYFRGSHLILMCFSVTDAGSFSNIRNWARNIEQHTGPQVGRVLVGLKSDMVDQRVISTEKAKALADEFGIKYFETSAKNSLNVEELFLTIARDVKKRMTEAGMITSGA